jgi:hypothetical protein
MTWLKVDRQRIIFICCIIVLALLALYMKLAGREDIYDAMFLVRLGYYGEPFVNKGCLIYNFVCDSEDLDKKIYMHAPRDSNVKVEVGLGGGEVLLVTCRSNSKEKAYSVAESIIHYIEDDYTIREEIGMNAIRAQKMFYKELYDEIDNARKYLSQGNEQVLNNLLKITQDRFLEYEALLKESKNTALSIDGIRIDAHAINKIRFYHIIILGIISVLLSMMILRRDK